MIAPETFILYEKGWCLAEPAEARVRPSDAALNC